MTCTRAALVLGKCTGKGLEALAGKGEALLNEVAKALEEAGFKVRDKGFLVGEYDFFLLVEEEGSHDHIDLRKLASTLVKALKGFAKTTTLPVLAGL